MALLGDDVVDAAFEEVDAVETETCGLQPGDEGPPQDPSVIVLDPEATHVAVEASEYEIDADYPTEAGRYSFVMTNAGDEPHMMVLAQLEEDAALDDVLASEGDEGVVDDPRVRHQLTGAPVLSPHPAVEPSSFLQDGHAALSLRYGFADHQGEPTREADEVRAAKSTLATVPIRHQRHRGVLPRPDTGGSTTDRLLVVEEHATTAAGLQLAMSEYGWDVETTSGPTASDVVAHAQRCLPQCVLLDVHLRNGVGNGIALIGPLKSTGAQVVMLTAERRRAVLAECLEAGAEGWIGTGAGPDEVDHTLRHLLAGGAIVGRTERAELLERLRLERAHTRRAEGTFDKLTHREALVLCALTDGLNAEEIAREHFVALTTVRSQIRSVLQKLGVNSQLAAVAIAADHRELLPQRAQAERDRRRPAPVARETGSELTVHIA